MKAFMRKERVKYDRKAYIEEQIAIYESSV